MVRELDSRQTRSSCDKKLTLSLRSKIQWPISNFEGISNGHWFLMIHHWTFLVLCLEYWILGMGGLRPNGVRPSGLYVDRERTVQVLPGGRSALTTLVGHAVFLAGFDTLPMKPGSDLRAAEADE